MAGGELVDPFAGTPKAVAPAKRIAVRKSTRKSAQLRDPWAPTGEGEAAAKRIKPRQKAARDLHTPFPKADSKAKGSGMTPERARKIEARENLRNPFG